MIRSEELVLRIEEALGSAAMERDPSERRRAMDSLQDVDRAHIIQVLEPCRWTIEGRGQWPSGSA
jgi:hypothetical protein